MGISYNADIQKAKDILEDILTEDPDTREDEEMVVFVDELAESSVIMGFRVWVDTDRYCLFFVHKMHSHNFCH